MNDAVARIGLAEDDEIELGEAALDLAALDHPRVPLAPYRARLDAMAADLARDGASLRTAQDRAALLAELVAVEHGIEGDRTTYDDPANADLLRALDRRRGLPVTLAILYVSIARRVGWQADALNTPGHVLVRLGPDPAPVLLDPFNRGAIVDATGLAALLARVLGRGASPMPEHVEPLSNRAVLVRLLTNQAMRARDGGDLRRALLLQQRLTAVAPSEGTLWWERARLENALGRRAQARASLGAMLETTRDAALRRRISAALDALAGSGRE